MKTVDLTPLIKNDSEYEELAASVSEHYKCEWDDAVHDSYIAYVKQVEERMCSVRAIRCKAEALVKEMYDLNIDELAQKAAILSSEAENI